MIDIVPAWTRASVNLALASNAAASGVMSPGDLWSVAKALREAAEPSPHVWGEAWTAVATAWRERAAQVPADSDRALLHAGYAELFAERLMDDGGDREATYRSGVRTIASSLAGFGFRCERVELPQADGGALTALWVPGTTGVAAVFMPGLDTTKEIWVALAGAELTRLGVSVLFVDGPGQGEALRVIGTRFRHDAERVMASARAFLDGQPQVDPHRVLVIGASMGGFLAARAAARTKDLAGVIIWGAVWDYHAVWASRLQAGASSPGDFAHLCRMTGSDDPRSAVGALRGMTMADTARDIEQPILILHGALDRQVPVDQAYALFDAVSSSDKTLATFDSIGAGASHVQVDNLAVGLHRITAWLRERFAGHDR